MRVICSGMTSEPTTMVKRISRPGKRIQANAYAA